MKPGPELVCDHLCSYLYKLHIYRWTNKIKTNKPQSISGNILPLIFAKQKSDKSFSCKVNNRFCCTLGAMFN